MIGVLFMSFMLQGPVDVSDGLVGTTSSYVDISVVPAAVWPVTAKEHVQAMAQQITITHRVRIRYREGIRGTWRLKYGQRIFEIVGIIDPNESHRWLDIMVKEKL